MRAAKLLFVTIIVSFILLVKFTESCDVGECYCDQVIYIETLRYQNRWLDAHHNKTALFTAPFTRDINGMVWAQWVVHCGSGNAVALESVRYPDHYLVVYHSRVCKVTYTADPVSADLALWYMEKRDDGATELRSKHYSDSRLDAHHEHRWAKITAGSGVWSGLRIYQPNNIASQYYDEVIYMESLRYPGRWLDAPRSKIALFTTPHFGDINGLPWPQWVVRCGPGGTVALESVRYPHHYLDAHRSRVCKVTYSADPASADWALWYLEERDDSAIELRSKRYPESRLDAYHANGWAAVTPGSGVWSGMKIYQEPGTSCQK